MTKIRGVVERITYQNPENGYSVLRVAVKGYNELITVVGNLVDANVGSVLLIEGDWKVDKKYGSQFIAQKWEETVPATVFGIEKYLGRRGSEVCKKNCESVRYGYHFGH